MHFNESQILDTKFDSSLNITPSETHIPFSFYNSITHIQGQKAYMHLTGICHSDGWRAPFSNQ